MSQSPLRRMMAFFALTAVATFLCLSTPSETTGQDKDTGKAAAGEPKVVFFDDFSGPDGDPFEMYEPADPQEAAEVTRLVVERILKDGSPRHPI